MNINFRRRKLNPKSTEVQKVLSKRLNNLCNFLNIEYNINSGGCCYIAYCLAKLLNEDNFKFTVTVYTDEELETEKFKDLDDSYFHYAISIGNYTINPEEDNDLYQYQYSKVKPSELLKHYRNGSWNECYNREKNDFLFKVIKNFYNDLTEDLRKG